MILPKDSRGRTGGTEFHTNAPPEVVSREKQFGPAPVKHRAKTFQSSDSLPAFSPFQRTMEVENALTAEEGALGDPNRDGGDDSSAAGGARPLERIVLPGDDVTEVITAAAEAAAASRSASGNAEAAASLAIRLGPGLVAEGSAVRATRAGVLCHRAPARFFVLSSTVRYVPAVGDTVVGIVVDRGVEA
jgi:hypothetical protein